MYVVHPNENAGVMINNKEFQRTCEFYYGETTFQEGFEKTRKHVCISVAASTMGVTNPVSNLMLMWLLIR